MLNNSKEWVVWVLDVVGDNWEVNVLFCVDVVVEDGYECNNDFVDNGGYNSLLYI